MKVDTFFKSFFYFENSHKRPKILDTFKLNITKTSLSTCSTCQLFIFFLKSVFISSCLQSGNTFHPFNHTCALIYSHKTDANAHPQTSNQKNKRSFCYFPNFPPPHAHHPITFPHTKIKSLFAFSIVNDEKIN
jgi:hypothetical protein